VVCINHYIIVGEYLYIFLKYETSSIWSFWLFLLINMFYENQIYIPIFIRIIEIF
jgi:hypothetical protein